MKIVLVRPNYQSHIITPVLSLGYLSSYLKKDNRNYFVSSSKVPHKQVKIIDGLKEDLSFEQLVKKILKEKPDIVGITCLTAFYNEVVELSKELKKHGIILIIGATHATFLPYQTLVDTKADFVICGEAEIALLKLVENKGVNNNIQGVYSLENLKDEKQKIVMAEAVEDLSSLDYPDWAQIDPRTYPDCVHGAIVKSFPVAPIITTRGCVYECSFCASPKFCGRKIRYREPAEVVGEIEYLLNVFGVKCLNLEDDNFTFNRDHAEEICNLIIKKKLKISFNLPNGVRADKVDLELLKLMKKAGCYNLAFGLESANTQILKNIKKHETIETIEKAIEMANSVGLSTQGFIIFGLPGETKETIRESIDFCKRSKLARAQFLILDVLPGSELWDTLEGKFTPNWNKNSYKEPEFLPNGLTKKYLMEMQAKAFREFYFRPVTFFRLARFIRPSQLKFIWKRLREYRILG